MKISFFLIPDKFSIISNKKFISVLKNRNTLILNKPSKYYFFKNIINIFKNIFIKNKELEFVPLKSKKNLLLHNHIYKIMNSSNKIFEKDNFLIEVINDLINYNNSIFETYDNLFRKKDIEFFFSDEIKFREMLVMGFYMKKILRQIKFIYHLMVFIHYCTKIKLQIFKFCKMHMVLYTATMPKIILSNQKYLIYLLNLSIVK